MKEAFSRVKWGACIVWPDSLAGNKLVVTYMGHNIGRALLFEGFCTAHILAIVDNKGLDAFTLIDAQYSLASTLCLAANLSKLIESNHVLCREVDIYYSPPPEEVRFREILIHYTMLRRTWLRSYPIPGADGIPGPGNVADDVDTSLDVVIADRVRRFWNGTWQNGRREHYCDNQLLGDGTVLQCCESPQETFLKAQLRGSKLLLQACDASMGRLHHLIDAWCSSIHRILEVARFVTPQRHPRSMLKFWSII